jgi:hypothetical protein
MGLKDALAANAVTKKGPVCTACTAINMMSEDDRADLQVALDDPVYTSMGISRALKAEGYEVSGQTIQRHRRRDCYKNPA